MKLCPGCTQDNHALHQETYIRVTTGPLGKGSVTVTRYSHCQCKECEEDYEKDQDSI